MKAQGGPKIDDLKNLPENRKCFDCHEKVSGLKLNHQGTTYAVMDFGVFVCSTCAGIHRDMTHKVKGIAMCNFNEKELDVLVKNGNEVSKGALKVYRMPKSSLWQATVPNYTQSQTKKTPQR